MVNKVILIGNLGKDPNIIITKSGDKIANFSLATSKKYKNKQGELIESTQWHNITVLNNLLVANVVEKYVSKGSKIYVEGEIVYETYEKEGEKKTATKIIVDKIVLLSMNQSQATGTQKEEVAKQDYFEETTPEEENLPF